MGPLPRGQRAETSVGASHVDVAAGPRGEDPGRDAVGAAPQQRQQTARLILELFDLRLQREDARDALEVDALGRELLDAAQPADIAQ